MTPGEFAAIEARANAASAGPWTADEFGVCDAHGEVIIEAEDWIPEAVDLAFIAAVRTDIPALLAAVRERDNTIARVREVGLLGLDEIAQKSIDATVARMHDQLGCTPDDLGPDVMAKIADSHIEQAELFAGPVLDALRAALDPQETE